MLMDFLNEGDEVIATNDLYTSSDHDEFRKSAKKGVIKAFTTRIGAIGYGRYGRDPGIFEVRDRVIVQWAGESRASTVTPYSIALYDDEEFSRRIQKNRAIHDDGDTHHLRYKHRITDLPELPFTAGDKVFIDGGIQGIINYISYEDAYLVTDPQNSAALSIYSIEIPQRGFVTRPAHEITLAERGNLHHWYRGNKADISFGSLSEEVSFAADVGLCHERPNPSNGLYKWSVEEAVEAVRSGLIDGFDRAIHPWPASDRALKFDDPDLAQRIKAVSLQWYEDNYPPNQNQFSM